MYGKVRTIMSCLILMQNMTYKSVKSLPPRQHTHLYSPVREALRTVECDEVESTHESTHLLGSDHPLHTTMMVLTYSLAHTHSTTE